MERLTVRVVAARRSSYPDPLLIVAGEVLSVQDRECDWDDWIWCCNQSGKCGWVPVGYIERRGDSCTALIDYDGTELSVSVGELLEVAREASGWMWCTNHEGRSGWVPAEVVEVYSEDKASPDQTAPGL